jgi:hypothetical protein
LHPFELDNNLDEELEKQMGLMEPLLDFKIGIQGAGESFSFVLTQEDFQRYTDPNDT